MSNHWDPIVDTIFIRKLTDDAVNPLVFFFLTSKRNFFLSFFLQFLPSFEFFDKTSKMADYDRPVSPKVIAWVATEGMIFDPYIKNWIG